MTTISYTNDIPDGPNNPSLDQPVMKLNTNAISQYVAVDHQPFNEPNSGYHTVIHSIPNGPSGTTDPAAILNIGQLYTKLVTVGGGTDTQLFFRTGLGGISQLTGNNASQKGYQWIGGLLIQWGKVTQAFTSSSTTGTELFDITFPNNIFTVNATFFSGSGAISKSNTISIVESFLNTTNFRWAVQMNDPAPSNYLKGFYWFAIGN